MPIVCLVTPSSQVEVLPDDPSPCDVLQGPLQCVVRDGLKTYWSLPGAWLHSEVNELASRLTGNTIKGDACLIYDSSNCTASQQQVLDDLLQSRTATTCRVRTSAGDASIAQQHCSRDQHAKADSSSQHAALKRARSRHHIAAANSTRQRILSGMRHGDTAATASAQAGSPPTTSDYSSSSCDTPCASRCRLSRPLQQHKAVTAAAPPRPHGPAAGDCGYGSGSLGAAPEQLQVPFSHLACGCDVATKRHLQEHESHDGSSLSTSSSSSGHERIVSAIDGCGPCGPGIASDARVSTGQQQQDSSSSSSIGHSSVTAPAWGQQGFPSISAAAACGSSTDAAWEDLSDEVIGRVASFLGEKLSSVMPVYLTCRAWRRAVLEDDQLLARLAFSLDVTQPFRGAPHPTAAVQLLRQRTVQDQHPALLMRAAKLGNLSALITRARCLDAAGLGADAMRCWKRAAKAGHLEGQLLLGLALYNGSAGLAQDPEDAHLWLSKAMKQVVPAGAAAGGESQPAAALEPVLRERVLGQGGLCLGYLFFDGEGVRSDRQEAVRLFKLAAAAGSKEAEQVLGWVFNTGQWA